MAYPYQDKAFGLKLKFHVVRLSCSPPIKAHAIDQWERSIPTHSANGSAALTSTTADGDPTAGNSQLCKRPKMETQSRIVSPRDHLFASFLHQTLSNNFPHTGEWKITGKDNFSKKQSWKAWKWKHKFLIWNNV